MACRLSSVRLWAARPAASVSRLMRSSSTEITSASVAKSPAAILKLVLSAGGSTKVPIPCRVSTRPEACSLESASRTTVRLTSKRAMISASVGSFSPGFNCPSRMPDISPSTISSTRPRARRGLSRAAAAAAGSVSLLGVFTRLMANAVDRTGQERENSKSSDNLQLKAVL